MLRYGWEPLPLFDFLEGMRVAANATTGRRFLDVGSGIGEKLEIAAMLGWTPQGVEVDPALAADSRTYWPHKVVVCDAFEFDGYDEFDLIYCYRPLINPVDQDTLNRVIVEGARSGTVLFFAGGPYPQELTQLGAQVWKI